MNVVVGVGVLPAFAGRSVQDVGMRLSTEIFGNSRRIEADDGPWFNWGAGRPQPSETDGLQYYPSSRLRTLEDGRVVGDDDYLQPHRGPR